MADEKDATAYECPVCGRELTNPAGGDLWTCAGGHMRKTWELTGFLPRKDARGTWHDLRRLEVNP